MTHSFGWTPRAHASWARADPALGIRVMVDPSLPDDILVLADVDPVSATARPLKVMKIQWPTAPTPTEPTMHYRAKLTLEEIEPYTDQNNYPREHTRQIASVDVTGGTPGAAMSQIEQHATELAAWHKDAAEVPR